MIDQIVSFSGLFQIICFLLLLVYVKQLFDKYGFAVLNKSFEQEKEKKIEQEKQYKVQVHAAQEAENNFKKEKEFTQILVEKINIWQEDFCSQEKQRIEDQKKAVDRLSQYLKKQEYTITLKTIRKDIFKNTIGQAEKKIITLFEKESEQQEFLDKACHIFKKDNA